MNQPAEHRVVFTPSGLQGTVPEGTTVLEAARELGVPRTSLVSRLRTLGIEKDG